jgi:uncharacterized protein (DUF1501 family)
MTLPGHPSARSHPASCRDCREAFLATDDDHVGVTRRTFVAGGVAALATAFAMDPLSAPRAWAATPASTTVPPVLVQVNLFGGMDGMSAIAPIGDPNYTKLRPTIAVPASAALPLDRMFGLHPALSPLTPFLDDGSLVLLHAVANPDSSRSHFDCSFNLEQGTFTGYYSPTGWLGRWLATLPSPTTYAGVAHDESISPSLMGPVPALAISSNSGFAVNVPDADRQPAITRTLNRVYGAGGDHPHPVLATGQQTLAALDTMSRLTATAYGPEHGAVYDPASGTAQALQDLAQLVKARVGLRAATLSIGGWDTHTDMGSVETGYMTDQLADLASALAAFATDLGPLMDSVTVVTVTEFGRDAQENGSRGLDHGWGQAMLVLGKGLKGGRQVKGAWPGLAPEQLDGEALAGTTDYRAVLSEVLTGRLGASSAEAAGIFPGFQSARVGIV